MKTAGIIAEYNPFHNGHFYHVRQTRAAGYSHIVAVMSGNVVQRSEVACFSKWTRASAAVKSGVNLVIELPAVYAVASAEKFASAGVSLLDGLGLIDGLSFGSESGNLQELYRCAEACMKINGSAELTGFLSQGLSFPKAREKSVEQIAGSEVSKLLRTPNNILGVEYLKALQNIGSSMEPITIRRTGPAGEQRGLRRRETQEPEAEILIVKTRSQVRLRVFVSNSLFDEQLQQGGKHLSACNQGKIRVIVLTVDLKRL